MVLANLSRTTKGYHRAYAREYHFANTYGHQWSVCVTPVKSRPSLGKLNSHRLHNMELAITRLTDLVIPPGGIFQFWRLIPHPASKTGFLTGPSIKNGILTEDYGGGLCQISSTLFNVFLEANFEILERENHSIDTHGNKRFIALGRDAAVAYGYKDLIVRNQNEVSLKLEIQLNKDEMKVSAKILAEVPLHFSVKTESEIIEEVPSKNPHGFSGWKVKTRRYICTPASDCWHKNYEVIDNYLPHDG